MINHRKPYRPRSDADVSEQYNDGVVTIYRVTDAAAPGYKPVPQLEAAGRLLYQERTFGAARYYAAKQNQVDIERLIRVQAAFCITPQDLARTEDGRLYRIDAVQLIVDTYPQSVDLTLKKYTQTEAD